MQPLCHWCNREINSDELIVAIVALRPEDEAWKTGSYGTEGAFIEEQPWHTVCFGVVQGAPEDD